MCEGILLPCMHSFSVKLDIQFLLVFTINYFDKFRHRLGEPVHVVALSVPQVSKWYVLALLDFNFLHAFCTFVLLCDFSKKIFFEKKTTTLFYVLKCQRFWIQFCQSWSGSKLFAKVISRWQMSPLAWKRVNTEKYQTFFPQNFSKYFIFDMFFSIFFVFWHFYIYRTWSIFYEKKKSLSLTKENNKINGLRFFHYKEK